MSLEKSEHKMNIADFLWKISSCRWFSFEDKASSAYEYLTYVQRRSYLVPTHLVPTYFVTAYCQRLLQFTLNLLKIETSFL